MLSETKTIDRIEVINNSTIQVREASIIASDGVEIAKSYHRYSFAPGSDVSAMPQEVQDIANLIWTPQVIADYEAQMKKAVTI